MSWLKINDSLNALKGQITNFAQEVLAEDPEEQQQQDENPEVMLIEANKQIENLQNLCSTQNNEILTLRRQILEFQQKSIEPSVSTKTEQNAGPGLEDSWFWESENNTSSSSSKNENEIISKSTSGGDLTIIPLDHPISESQIVENLKKKLIDYEQKLEKTHLENAVLNEKLTQIQNENKELNDNIEELDKQHNMAIEEILTVKTNIQSKYSKLQKEFDFLNKNLNELSEYRDKYENLEKSCLKSNEEHLAQQKLCNKLKNDLESAIQQNNELTTLLESKEEILKGLANLRNENLIGEQSFIELKNNNLYLQKEIHELKSQLENSEEFCDKIDNLEKLLSVEKSKSIKFKKETEKLNDKIDDLTKKLDESETNYRQLLLEKETEAEEIKSLLEKSEKSEKLLQTQIIDLQSTLNSRSTQVTTSNQKASGLTLLELKNIVKHYSDFENLSIDDETKYLEEFLKTVRDSQSKINALEKQLFSLNEEKDKILHEKTTIQADLLHYEIECTELMKNNEIILTELDTLKSNKLETIPENNEESIVILEQQLEDCSNLNRSLEDEYLDIQQKLELSLNEKLELTNRLIELEKEIEIKNNKCKELQSHIQGLESEKCNLIFEINEIKTDDFKASLEIEINEYKTKISTLEDQIMKIKDENVSFVKDLQTKLDESLEYNNKSKEINEDNCKKIDALSENLKEKENLLENSAIELRQLKENENLQKNYNIEFDELNKKLNEKTNEFNELEKIAKENEQVKRTLEEDLVKSNTLIADLEEKLKFNLKNEIVLEENKNYKQTLENLIKEKNDLIALITIKHNESLQYHAEIQRLSQMLQKASDESQLHLIEIEKLKSEQFSSDDREKMADQIQFLREKSDIMTKNLLAEQTNQKVMVQEKQELMEQKQNLARDLERLRIHLLEIEEAHTQETVELQKMIDDSKIKICFLEEETKKSTTAYTSASIRANQQTETLQAQYLILQQQRDDISAKLSQAEDRESKNQAALVNLQCALEQFQRDKDRDIEATTQRLRTELETEKLKQKELTNEIQNLQQQLSDAKNGLLAASRISDQLEMSQITIATLKTELMKSQDKCITLENKLHDNVTNQADKVEKSLIKNLLIGYIVSVNQTDKQQILKLISSVLDFNQNETEKVGLNRIHGSWLNSIISGGAGPQSSSGEYNKESLAQAFVKFLEKESQPRIKAAEMPTLLNIHPVRRTSTNINPLHNVSTESLASSTAGSVHLTTTIESPSSSLSSQQQQQQEQQNIAVQPLILHENVLPSFAPTRNSSSILKEILNDS